MAGARCARAGFGQTPACFLPLWRGSPPLVPCTALAGSFPTRPQASPEGETGAGRVELVRKRGSNAVGALRIDLLAGRTAATFASTSMTDAVRETYDVALEAMPCRSRKR